METQNHRIFFVVKLSANPLQFDFKKYRQKEKSPILKDIMIPNHYLDTTFQTHGAYSSIHQPTADASENT